MFAILFKCFIIVIYIYILHLNEKMCIVYFRDVTITGLTINHDQIPDD